MRSRIAAAAVVVVALVPSLASAGRTYYGWLYGTEVMPERGAELQTWVHEENLRGPDGARISESLLWWAPLVGVTDQLELALPVEATWSRVEAGESEFTFRRWGVEARYRFVSQDPVDAPAFAPLLRVAVKRDVGARDAIQPEVDVVLSYESGRVHALLDLGFVASLTRDDRRLEFRPGAGVSIQAVGDLRFGVEVYAELDVEGSAYDWAIIAPNLAWTHGRFWLSAAMGIGIYEIKDAPRVMWGIAF